MKPRETAVDRPIKLLIADAIRIQIESGELAPGASLPTIQEICEQWNCSTASAREALALLRQQGLVSGGRGKPLTVRTPHRRAVRSSDRHQAEKDLVLKPQAERALTGTSEIETGVSIEELRFRSEYGVIKATEALAAIVGVNVGAELLRREHETTEPRTGHRVAWSVSYIPVELIKANPAIMDDKNEPWPGGTQHQLYTVGIEIMTMIDEVTAKMPTTVDRQVWGLENGVPMLLVRRVSIDKLDRIVEVSDAEFPADRTQLVFRTPLKSWGTES
jgi:GntR family transcriptional regulator